MSINFLVFLYYASMSLPSDVLTNTRLRSVTPTFLVPYRSVHGPTAAFFVLPIVF